MRRKPRLVDPFCPNHFLRSITRNPLRVHILATAVPPFQYRHATDEKTTLRWTGNLFPVILKEANLPGTPGEWRAGKILRTPLPQSLRNSAHIFFGLRTSPIRSRFIPAMENALRASFVVDQALPDRPTSFGQIILPVPRITGNNDPNRALQLGVISSLEDNMVPWLSKHLKHDTLLWWATAYTVNLTDTGYTVSVEP